MAKKKVIIQFCFNVDLTDKRTPAELLEQVSGGEITFDRPDVIQIISETGEILATNEMVEIEIKPPAIWDHGKKRFIHLNSPKP